MEVKHEKQQEAICKGCGESFSSRNKLFRHLKLCRIDKLKDSVKSTLLTDLEDTLQRDDKDVRLYAIGGRHRNKTLSSTEYYSFRTDSWHDGPFLLEHRGSHGSVTLDDGSIFVMSGGGLNTNLISCEILHHGENLEICNQWKSVPASMKIERHALGVCQCENLIFAVGGWVDGRQCSADVEKYNVKNGQWEQLPTMHLGRRLCGCVAISVPGSEEVIGSEEVPLSDEFKLYIFGGQIDNSNHLGFDHGEKSNGWVTACAEVYDSRTKEWQQIKEMPVAGPTSVVTIGKNEIYVIIHGASIYKYCPKCDELNLGPSGEYIKVAPLPLKHWYCFDVCTYGRRIFFTGGSVHGRWSTAFFEFDTTSSEFLQRPPMMKERRRGSCSLVEVPKHA